MGIIKVFIYTFGGISSGLFIALRLGKNLEVSSRHTGRMIGLFYRYIKVILFNLKPKTQEPGEIIRMMRNINQQSHAFTRELHENLADSKKDLGVMIPALKPDYLEKRKKEFSLALNSKLTELNNFTTNISKSVIQEKDNLSIQTSYLNDPSLNNKSTFTTNNSINSIISNDNKRQVSIEETYSADNYLKSKNGISGTDILEFSLLERRKIIKKKKDSQRIKEELY
jgi:hypothetical protein